MSANYKLNFGVLTLLTTRVGKKERGKWRNKSNRVLQGTYSPGRQAHRCIGSLRKTRRKERTRFGRWSINQPVTHLNMSDSPVIPRDGSSQQIVKSPITSVSTHKNVSCMITSQDGYNIPPSVRRNLNANVIWKLPIFKQLG